MRCSNLAVLTPKITSNICMLKYRWNKLELCFSATANKINKKYNKILLIRSGSK